MSTIRPRELTCSNELPAIDEHTSKAVHRVGEQARALIRQISLTSTREVDWLIGDLNDLRDKLESRGSRIQTDIVEYASLSQSAVELAKIVTDSVLQVEKRSATLSGDVAELVIPPFLKQSKNPYGGQHA